LAYCTQLLTEIAGIQTDIATQASMARFQSMGGDNVIPIGDDDANRRLDRIAARLEEKYVDAAHLYAATRAETAGNLGSCQRSRAWRIVAGIIKRRRRWR
jgi:hypothetical protein